MGNNNHSHIFIKLIDCKRWLALYRRKGNWAVKKN